MNRPPKVSVLMPVYNALPHLAEAIESILTQTFWEFEFVIVDDGSSDGSRDVILDYARRDGRLKVLLKKTNSGPADTLNTGLEECRGEYIARMDADDIALPQRFQRQIDFMDASPEVGVSGTWFTVFGDANGACEHPLTDGEIKVHHLLRHTALGHPTVFMRKHVLDQVNARYRNEAFPAEDLWFWIELGFSTRLANLPDPLLLYRSHSAQISEVRKAVQNAKAAAAQAFYAGTILGRPLDNEEKRLHAILSDWMDVEGKRELENVRRYGELLLSANRTTGYLDQALLEQAIYGTLGKLPHRYAERSYKYARKFDLPLLMRYVRDPLRPFRSLSFEDSLRFAAKCILHHEPQAKL